MSKMKIFNGKVGYLFQGATECSCAVAVTSSSRLIELNFQQTFYGHGLG
jgi:hypothetical protein